MGLLWKDDNPVLPYNRSLAEARLQYLKRRFHRDPELEAKYRAVIEDCVAKGYARRLSKEEGMFYQTSVTPSDADALRFLW